MPNDTGTGDGATQNALSKVAEYDAGSAIEAILFPPSGEATGENAAPPAEAEEAGQAADADAEQGSESGESADADSTTPDEVVSQDSEADEASESNGPETEQAEGEEQEEVAAEAPKRDGMQKRIDKLTRQRRELEAKLKEQEAKLAELATAVEQTKQADAVPAPVVQSDNPFAVVDDPAKLEVERDNALRVLDVLDPDMDEYTYTGSDGKQVTLDKVAIKAARKQARAALDVHIPRQERFLQQRQTVLPQVKTLYPQLFDKTNQAYSAAQNLLRQLPELRRLPNYEQIVARYLVGEQAEANYLAKAKAPAKPATAAKKAPAQPKAPVVAPKPPLRKADAEAATFRDRWTKSRDNRDLADYLGRIV
jgi:hypothetical protein